MSVPLGKKGVELEARKKERRGDRGIKREREREREREKEREKTTTTTSSEARDLVAIPWTLDAALDHQS